jgi:hypothetical protein
MAKTDVAELIRQLDKNVTALTKHVQLNGVEVKKLKRPPKAR